MRVRRRVSWQGAAAAFSGFTISQAEGRLRGLARDTGADIAVTDEARLLRLPAFVNHKYRVPHLVTVEDAHRRNFTPADFPIFSDGDFIAASPSVPHTSSGQPHTVGDTSRSGQDWRLVLSRLRRGANPDCVIQDLADSRRGKAKPMDYATQEQQQTGVNSGNWPRSNRIPGELDDFVPGQEQRQHGEKECEVEPLASRMANLRSIEGRV